MSQALMRRLASVLFVSFVAVFTSSARAESFSCPNPKSTNARDRESVKLFNQAIAREAADPDGALERLRCADGLADRPAVALRRGLIAERLGKNEEAIAALERYLALSGEYAPDKADMEKHIARLKSAKANVVAEPDPDPALQPEPEPDRPPPDNSTKKTIGYVTLGVGSALMVVGGVLLYSAKQKSDAVHDVDPASKTPWQSGEGEERLDAAKRQQTWGFIALGVGAIGAGTGAFLILDTSERSAFVGFRRAF